MPEFGTASQKRFDQLDVKLQSILQEAIEHIDFSIISGHRGRLEQERLHRNGFSKAPWPYSKHNRNPSKAVDIAPYFNKKPHIDWNDKEGFIYLAGVIKGLAWQKNIELRWGGDWDRDNDQRDENFRDLGHFELVD